MSIRCALGTYLRIWVCMHLYICACVLVCIHTPEKLPLEFVYMLPEMHSAVRSCDRAYVLLLFLVEGRVCVPA